MKDTEKDLFLISLFTFITVSLWITFELLKATKTSTVESSIERLVTPLSPTIDTDTLNVLQQKKP